MQFIKFKQFINEKRRNSALNKKISTYEELLQYCDNDDYYITFTDYDILKINPSTEWYNSTPKGIYFFPLKLSWKYYKIDNKKTLHGFPYITHRQYVFLVKANNNKILDLKKYTKSDLLNDVIKLKKLKYNEEKIDSFVNDRISTNEMSGKTIYELCLYISSDYNIKDTTTEQDYPITKWSMIFDKLGYIGITDKGDSIIYGTQPVQTVIFKKEYCEIIKLFRNTYNFKHLDDDITIIKTYKDIQQFDNNVIMNILKFENNEVVELEKGIKVIFRTNIDKLLLEYFKNCITDFIKDIPNTKIYEFSPLQSLLDDYILQVIKIEKYPKLYDFYINVFKEKIIKEFKTLDSYKKSKLGYFSKANNSELFFDNLEYIFNKVKGL